MGNYAAGFITNENINDCRVTKYGLVEIEDYDNYLEGGSVQDLMSWAGKKGENHFIYIHDMKFYGPFIVSWALENGYKLTTSAEDRAPKTFNTLISNEGEWYQLEVIFYKRGKNINRVIFLDSRKLLPMPEKEIADAFRLERKGPPCLKTDITIIAQAIGYMHEKGYTRMTIGSNALKDFKNTIGDKTYKRLFPLLTPECYKDLRQAYRGGFTYLEPEFQGKTVKNGIVIDVNSLFADRMNSCLMPYGNPKFFRGKYEHDEIYPLYTQMFRCMFELKPGKLPTIQVKHGYDFDPVEYLTSSNDNEVMLVLNSPDLELFFEHYDVYNIEWFCGWKYQGYDELFKEYIEKWNQSKIRAKEEHNPGLYTISKLFLVSFYGKFGTAVTGSNKYPYLSSDGSVNYYDGPQEKRPGVYLPVASFTTSYARCKTIRAAQKVKDDYKAGRSKIKFIYADTDSLHCISEGQELPEGFEIDPVKLGAWKFEGKFKRAKYLRQKCYIQEMTEDVYNEDPEYKIKITVAGMPDDVKPNVNFNNFRFNEVYQGAKKAEAVPGGVMLVDHTFTLKP